MKPTREIKENLKCAKYVDWRKSICAAKRNNAKTDEERRRWNNLYEMWELERLSIGEKLRLYHLDLILAQL